MADYGNLEDILDKARTCVHRGQSPQALAYLRSIQLDIEELEGKRLWAEYQLVYAGALAGMNEDGAEAEFEEALNRCIALNQPDPALTMKTHGDYGKYLAGRQATARAREHYRAAEKIAENLGREQCMAQFQMCIIRLELEEVDSPHLPAFQRLQEAAKDGYTEVEQRDAWIHYDEEFEGIAPQLVATRKGGEASVDYFRGILSKIRRAEK